MASVFCAALILAGLLGAWAPATPDRADSYPSTSRRVCEQEYGGTFTPLTDSRSCSVVSDAGTILYVGYGAGGFDRVLTTKTAAHVVFGDVRLGPATVGCHKPDMSAGGGWAVDCM